MNGILKKSAGSMIRIFAAAAIAGCVSPNPNAPLGTIDDPVTLSPQHRAYRIETPIPQRTALPPVTQPPQESEPLVVEQPTPEPDMLPAPGGLDDNREQGPSLTAPPRIRSSKKPPRLFLDVSRPERVSVGGDVVFRITVRNEGGQIAKNVEVHCMLGDGGLTFPNQPATEVKREIGDVVAGDAQEMELTLVASKRGRQCAQFSIKSEGKEAAWKSVCTDVVDKTGSLSLGIIGPEKRTVGSRAEYNLKITNTSGRPLNGIVASLKYDDALIPREATEGVEDEDAGLVWNLGDLQPNEGLQLQVEFDCSRVQDRAVLQAEAGEAGSPTQRSDTELAIIPLPGVLDLQVADEEDPIKVGEEFTYVVDVGNKGFQTAQLVQLAVSPSSGVTLLDAEVIPESLDQQSRHRVVGRRWEFEPIDRLPADSTVQYRIRARAIRAGDHTLRAMVRSELSTTPFVVNELTTINER